MDTTVKPLYGHQQGAVVGYNPKKPGRPSHTYHTFAMAGTRLILDVDVRAGNQHASNYSASGLWAWFDRTPRDQWPALLRGDAGFGNEAIMREAEQRSALSVQVAPDLQRQTHDRPPVAARGMG